jgi:hypothetical protein
MEIEIKNIPLLKPPDAGRQLVMSIMMFIMDMSDLM